MCVSVGLKRFGEFVRIYDEDAVRWPEFTGAVTNAAIYCNMADSKLLRGTVNKLSHNVFSSCYSSSIV